MKAMICKKYGAASDVLQIKEIEKPKFTDDEVLIRVYACTVNRTDSATIRAKPFIMRFVNGLFKPKKQILGTDFAGQIETVGKNVTNFKIGDRVFGFNDLGVCSFAEYLKLDTKKSIGIIPENFSYSEAAASLEGSHYAYNFINKVKLISGQKVLVYGATGAIGSAMVQILKYFGIHVTAVSNTRGYELIKSLGVDILLDYQKEDFTALNPDFDFVFDAVGKSSFGVCKKLLKKGGVYISSELGKNSENIFYSLFTPFFGNKKVIFPIPSDYMRTIQLIEKMISEKKYKAVIDKTYSLEEIPIAFDYVESGQKLGNVVILL